MHTVTAEPGGSGEIRRKLIANGLEDLKFPVYSDPTWSLMTLEPREKIYVENPSHEFLLEAKQFDEPYRMVQPALAILDNKGEVIYWWSWSKLQAGVVNEEDQILPNSVHEEGNHTGNTHDVRWRPVPDDILLKLTQGGNLDDIRVDNLGFPDGKDHLNSKKNLFKNPAANARAQLEQQKRTGMKAKIFNDDVQAKKCKL